MQELAGREDTSGDEQNSFATFVHLESLADSLFIRYTPIEQDSSGTERHSMNRAEEFVFAIRLFGEPREFLVVKATPRGDYFAFLPYSRIPKLPRGHSSQAGPHADIHFSKHRSDERHLRWKLGDVHIRTRETVVRLQPTGCFSGVELLIHASMMKGQFSELPVAGSAGSTINLPLLLLSRGSLGLNGFRVHAEAETEQ